NAPVRIEHARRGRVHHRERLYHRAGVQEVDLEAAAAHGVDLGHVITAVIAEDVRRAETALHLQGEGLRARNLRHRNRCNAGDRGAAEEPTTRRSRGFSHSESSWG